MGTRTGNATWQDSPSTATLITAAKLEAVESILDASVPSAPGIRPKVSSFVGPFANDGNGASADALATGVQYPCLIVVSRQITIDQIGFNVDTSEAVNARALLYSSDTDGHPVTLVADSGGISCSTTANKIATITPVILPGGLYWGFIRSNSGTTVRFRSCKQVIQPAVDSAFNNLTASQSAIKVDPGTYASPSATISTWAYDISANGNIHPIVILRRSA